MAHKVLFAADAEQDFELVFEFLVESYLGFGEAMQTAIKQAERRIQSIREEIEGLTGAPHRGTLHDDLLPGLRHVTLGQAVVWFDIVEESEEVRILAVIFGGKDHQRRMLARLLE